MTERESIHGAIEIIKGMIVVIGLTSDFNANSYVLTYFDIFLEISGKLYFLCTDDVNRAQNQYGQK